MQLSRPRGSDYMHTITLHISYVCSYTCMGRIRRRLVFQRIIVAWAVNSKQGLTCIPFSSVHVYRYVAMGCCITVTTYYIQHPCMHSVGMLCGSCYAYTRASLCIGLWQGMHASLHCMYIKFHSVSIWKECIRMTKRQLVVEQELCAQLSIIAVVGDTTYTCWNVLL